MLDKKITFDRFIRGLVALLVFIIIVFLVRRLSDVLVPFFVAWLLAYMIYPLVSFLQNKVRLRSRVVSIVVAMSLVLVVVCGALALVLPSTVSETLKVYALAENFAHDALGQSHVMSQIHQYITRYANTETVLQLLKQKDVISMLQYLGVHAWKLLYSTVDFLVGIVGLCVIVLYTFFILMDYEQLSNGWSRLIPAAHRPFAVMVVEDVKAGMNAYFRGQALVAFCVGVLFSIGFLIIDFPMAIGLGVFIGLLNMVPYMQLIGFFPTVMLALVKAAETGQNFWLVLLCALAVFAVVQCIQDFILVPRIMNKVTGLNPAVILLSLSIWGSLLGVIGLIIALPLSSLVLSYYKRFVLKEGADKEPTDVPQEA